MDKTRQRNIANVKGKKLIKQQNWRNLQSILTFTSADNCLHGARFRSFIQLNWHCDSQYLLPGERAATGFLSVSGSGEGGKSFGMLTYSMSFWNGPVGYSCNSWTRPWLILFAMRNTQHTTTSRITTITLSAIMTPVKTAYMQLSKNPLRGSKSCFGLFTIWVWLRNAVEPKLLFSALQRIEIDWQKMISDPSGILSCRRTSRHPCHRQ